MATHLLTPKGVLSFPALFAPKARSQGSEPVYSCSILFAPAEQKSPEYKALQQGVLDVAKEKFGANVNMKALMLPFRDAAEKEYEGYGPGVIYINPWTKTKPGIVDGRLQDVLDRNEVYAGQIVRANVTPFAWTNSGKRGVSFGLNHIQLVDKNAPRIDGRIAANKAFTPLEDLEDADSPF